MDLVRPAHALEQRKQPDMIDDGVAAASAGPGVAGAADHVGAANRGLAQGTQTRPCPLVREAPPAIGRSVSSSASSFVRSAGSIRSSASSQKA